MGDQKGFGLFGVFIIVVVVGVIGGAGWYVMQSDKNKDESGGIVASQSDNDKANEVTEEGHDKDLKDVPEEDLVYNKFDGMLFTIPEGWMNADSSMVPYNLELGEYLLSPDYKEAGMGVLKIESGAFIHFERLSETDYPASLTLEDYATRLRVNEGGYIDRNTIQIQKLGGIEYVSLNAGHTADGIEVTFKDRDGRWYTVYYATKFGSDGKYNAQNSDHYKTFMTWLEQFLVKYAETM